jgi:hypothetical protein
MFETIEEIIKQKEAWKLENEIRTLEIELEVNKKQNHKNFKKFCDDLFYEHRIVLEEKESRIMDLEIALSEFDLDSENVVRTLALEGILGEGSKVFEIVDKVMNEQEFDWDSLAVH